MPSRPLRRILLPIPDGDYDASEQQYPEQRQDQIASASLVHIITRRCGQEMPNVGEGIGGHVRVLREIEQLLYVAAD